MNKVTKYLNQHTVGNIFDKPSILAAYATDRSPLAITPRYVAIPSCTEDIQFIAHFIDELTAHGFPLPIAVRGSGLDATGADLSDGLVISTEKLGNVQEIDPRSRLVRVQAGVTLEKLNSTLSAHGLTIPLKTNPKQTIGGLISNFPTDISSKKYGSIYYYVERIEAVMACGELIQTTSLTSHGARRKKMQTNFEGTVYRELSGLMEEQLDLMEKIASYPDRCSGYRMISEVKNNRHHTFDLTPLFFAAQGTLGIITEVILRCEPLLSRPARILSSFRSLRPALDFAKALSLYKPYQLNLYDASILQSATEQGKNPGIVSKRMKKGYYVYASFNGGRYATRHKLNSIQATNTTAVSTTIENQNNTKDFDMIDELLNVYLNNADKDRMPLVSSAHIPTKHLQAFVSELRELEETFKRPLPIYGSYATEVFSVRPSFDLSVLSERKSALQFMQAYGMLVEKHHGSIAGAGAEGRTRALVTNGMHTERERELYQNIKQLFDPQNILNPDVKLGSTPNKVVHHLRKAPFIGVMDD